jgi:hypothetical protein
LYGIGNGDKSGGNVSVGKISDADTRSNNRQTLTMKGRNVNLNDDSLIKGGTINIH